MDGHNFYGDFDVLFDQHFEELQKKCLKSKHLFVDQHFSMGSAIEDAIEGVLDSEDWIFMRPTDIVKKPEFVTNGISRFDINQGSIGDCWFLAATASLTLYPELFNKVVPGGQSFQENYAGIFHFRFWQFGRWVDVVIDDVLPVLVDADKIAKYTKSTDPNEFWISLLEKAYAKFRGSYGLIDGGWPRMALLDFTGGFIESYDLITGVPATDLFCKIQAAILHKAVITGIVYYQKDYNAGLVEQHAYSVTGATIVKILKGSRKGQKRLVRIRNPHGVAGEEYVKGWADKSKEWKYVSSEEKSELNVNFQDDGEYWMSFRKFVKHFDLVDICHVPGTANSPLRVLKQFNGEWTTNGGCGDQRDSPEYAKNPQLFVNFSQESQVTDNELYAEELTSIEEVFDHLLREKKVENCVIDSEKGDKGRIEEEGEVRDEDEEESEKIDVHEVESEISNEDEEESEISDEDEQESEISDEEDLIQCGKIENDKLTIMIDLLTEKSITNLRKTSAKIGFDIYYLSNSGHLPEKLEAEFFRDSTPIESVHPLDDDMREVSGRFAVAPGNYCIVPYCYTATDEDPLEQAQHIDFGPDNEDQHDLNSLNGPFKMRIFIYNRVIQK